ncbi:MAG: SCP2 sterol-binding domain-containing protein [Candidatus Thermoplasmatota archaeon]|jgi:putative sterol carrier protein|nr:SCP2 sterol-binding domain-containing protein [Candidatus Thermoplasmatota archaeon]MCL5964110.1 SCP2 sterol-binding domain-containing protein [Candidatus Thermoplasmatota archaeon]
MTSEEVLNGIVSQLNSNEKVKTELKGWNKVLQFDVKDVGKYYLTFSNDGTGTVSSGVHSSPNVTLSTDDQSMTDILTGKLDGVRAAFMGKLKINGDIFSAQKMVSILEKLRKTA